MFTRFFADSLASGGALPVTSTAGDVIGSSRSYWGGAANGELEQLMLWHAFSFVEMTPTLSF